jgi:hypothetical protein
MHVRVPIYCFAGDFATWTQLAAWLDRLYLT